MKKVKLLLEQLTEKIPPGPGQRHNITFDGVGLVVTLMLGEKNQPLTFNEDGLDKSADELVGEILEAVELLEITGVEKTAAGVTAIVV